MNQTRLRIKTLAVALVLVMLLCVLGFFNNLYEGFTCHGCFHFPGYKYALEENVLGAIYLDPRNPARDTIYLSRSGTWKREGYHEYSSDFFFGIPLEIDPRVAEIVNGEGQSIGFKRDFYFGGRVAFDAFPAELICLDSAGVVIQSYQLAKRYEDNLDDQPRRSYLKAWREYLK